MIGLPLFVLAVLDARAPALVRVREVAAVLDEDPKLIGQALGRLRLRGLAARIAGGGWLVTETGRAHLARARADARRLMTHLTTTTRETTQ